MRDETDLGGLKLTIDLKRGVDPEKLMQKLFRMTPLQDSFACNFNILIAGMPRVLGVGEILDEWTAWRMDCVAQRASISSCRRSRTSCICCRACEKILLDIDKAIAIIRETESEAEVVPNLMIGFGIDQTQAEYVAEIKLRNINKEYILKHTTADRASWSARSRTWRRPSRASARKFSRVIMDELHPGGKEIRPAPDGRGLAVPRSRRDRRRPEDETPDYPVHLFVSREGYLKKITPQSLRMTGQQTL